MVPVVITAAVTGSVTSRKETPYLPVSVEENVTAAVDAWRAGAAMIHVHAREDDGTPTQRVDRFKQIVEGIRAQDCDVIVNLTTSSAAGRVSGPERYACLRLRPEMGSFDCGSLNFGERVFENSPQFLRDMARQFLDYGVKPEIECFDTGQIYNALRLRDEGLLEDPLHFQFVVGVRGGAPATIEQVTYMKSLIPTDSTWSVCAIGRAQLSLNVLCLIADGHVRTGLEDNIYYERGVLATSNAQLVSRIVRLAGELGRPIAGVAQAREMLSLRAPMSKQAVS
jgi:3-keto-5-aminohexanoate cleavage enzyme